MDFFAQKNIGPLSQSLVMSGLVTALLCLVSWLATRKPKEKPGLLQTAAEGVVAAIESTVDGFLPGQGKPLVPFVGTLWLYLVVANLLGLVPGLESPTRDLSATAGLAFLVFLSVHWFGVRSQGWKSYLRHYLSPSPILLPFHLISEVTRTLALAVRLFGNMMSLEMTAMLVLLVAGFLAPVPILMLHVVEALVQAYIFGMLALVYLAGGIQSQQTHKGNEENHE